MTKHCAIFFYEGYIGVAPTVANLAILLTRENYQITVYATKNPYPEVIGLKNKVKIFYFLKGTRLFDKLKIYPSIKNLIPLLAFLFYLFPTLVTVYKNPRQLPTINIAVDIYGVITALIIKMLFKQPFIFLICELRSPQHFQGFSKILTTLAEKGAKAAKALVIQDGDRLKTFINFYHHKPSQVFYLANSPLKDEIFPESTNNFFREKFNLNQEQFPILLLQAGMIADVVLSPILAKTFSQIKSQYALIFHERNTRKEDPYIQQLRQINSHNLFLSLQPVPYDQIATIYQSVDIGLACYEGKSENYQYIASASGKLLQYLKYGKPVIVNNLPSLREFVQKYQVGQVINDPTDPQAMQQAIAEILAHYDFYQGNALTCFEQELEFGHQAKPLIEFIKNSNLLK